MQTFIQHLEFHTQKRSQQPSANSIPDPITNKTYIFLNFLTIHGLNEGNDMEIKQHIYSQMSAKKDLPEETTSRSVGQF